MFRPAVIIVIVIAASFTLVLATPHPISIIYTAGVAGHLFEVDGDGRPCVRNEKGDISEPTPASSQSNRTKWNAAKVKCGGGLAGRKNFFDRFYLSKGTGNDEMQKIRDGQERTLTIDTGNHFYGSREFFYNKASGMANYSKMLGYDAFMLSAKDMHASPKDLDLFSDPSTPFVASNLVRLQRRDGPLKQMLESEKIVPYHIVNITVPGGVQTALQRKYRLNKNMPKISGCAWETASWR